jgi:uncharacterized protein YjiS (DUF1127 family)
MGGLNMTTDHREFTATSVRRTRSGAVDMEYYTRRARALRAETVGLGLGRFGAWLGRLVRRLITRIARLRTRNALAALDHRMLQDLGIGRSDIDAIASGDFFTDVTRQRQAHDHTDRGTRA